MAGIIKPTTQVPSIGGKFHSRPEQGSKSSKRREISISGGPRSFPHPPRPTRTPHRQGQTHRCSKRCKRGAPGRLTFLTMASIAALYP